MIIMESDTCSLPRPTTGTPLTSVVVTEWWGGECPAKWNPPSLPGWHYDKIALARSELALAWSGFDYAGEAPYVYINWYAKHLLEMFTRQGPYAMKHGLNYHIYLEEGSILDETIQRSQFFWSLQLIWPQQVERFEWHWGWRGSEATSCFIVVLVDPAIMHGKTQLRPSSASVHIQSNTAYTL